MTSTVRSAMGRASAALPVAILLAILADPCLPKAIHTLAGPFRIIPDHVEHCPPELEGPEPIVFYVASSRDRHNQDLWTYWGNFTTKFAWTDNQDVDVNVASWSSRGGWKPNAFVFRVKHYCKAFRTHVPMMWRKVTLAISGTPDHECYWPPGVYYVRNLTTDFSIKAIPTFFYGKWRATLRLMENNYQDTLGCMVGYAETVPLVT